MNSLLSGCGATKDPISIGGIPEPEPGPPDDEAMPPVVEVISHLMRGSRFDRTRTGGWSCVRACICMNVVLGPVRMGSRPNAVGVLVVVKKTGVPSVYLFAAFT